MNPDGSIKALTDILATNVSVIIDSEATPSLSVVHDEDFLIPDEGKNISHNKV